jgi:hypothetical protein
MTRKRERLYSVGLAVVLVCGVLVTFLDTLSNRDEQAAVEANARHAAAFTRSRVEMEPVAFLAGDFLMGLDREDDKQLKLTTDVFRARHSATGGVLRLRLPDGKVFGAIDQEGPSFSDRWRGSLGGGRLEFRGDVLKDGAASGNYTITVVRNLATGRWAVDAFTLSE